jgi:fructose-bisphosphate aldolase, class I
MNIGELNATARAMVAKNKGLLAADESTSTITKRFDTIKLDSTEENRRAYREMLFTAAAAQQYISGVILYDETIRQKTKDGTPFPAYLTKFGMIPGIKVDLGAKPLAGFPNETMTEGLDGLRERLAEYYKLGARFAKWRAVINIDSGVPTHYAIDANAEGLARYASLCQEAGIVPIVEPEVLMDGGHSLERCEEVTNVVLDTVFSRLFSARVALEGMILKPNMVIPGKKAPNQSSPTQIAEATVRTLKRRVPAAVPGIAFLSGGQSPTDATLHLSLMHAAGPMPWPLTFSYGRALQEDALKAWEGKPAGFAGGQKALSIRAKLNGLAATGEYTAAMESSAA